MIRYPSYSIVDQHAKNIGLYGFGAAAYLLIQIANYQHKQVFAFTTLGDKVTQQFARLMGAVWAGDSDQLPSEIPDAAILFAPVGSLVPRALAATDKGGQVICRGIHMSDMPSLEEIGRCCIGYVFD